MSLCGIVGGLSYVSTLDYYRLVNEYVNKHQGGLHSARLIVYSLNLAEYASFLMSGENDKVIALISSAAEKLKDAGCDFIVIASNTAHIAASFIEAKQIPILHIVDCCVYQIKSRVSAPSKIGFLGTKYSMEKDYIKNRFAMHNIQIEVPKDPAVRNEIQRVIEEELSHTPIITTSKQIFLSEIAKMFTIGVQAVVLGCTEIPLLIKQEDFPEIPLIDSGDAHIQLAAKLQLDLVSLSEILPQNINK